VFDEGPVEGRAVQTRHLEIADDRVEGPAGGGVEPRLAVPGVGHHVAGIPQAFDDGRGQPRFVLHQQYRRARARFR